MKNKTYKIRLYPNKLQQELINKTIGCSSGDREYVCNCGLKIDRDLNASLNLKNFKNKSLESSDYEHGENVRPLELNFKDCFEEVFIKSVA